MEAEKGSQFFLATLVAILTALAVMTACSKEHFNVNRQIIPREPDRIGHVFIDHTIDGSRQCTATTEAYVPHWSRRGDPKRGFEKLNVSSCRHPV